MATTLASDADILNKIEAFCAKHDMAPTAFGRAALSDGNLVTNLRDGRSLTLKSAGRILAFMAEAEASSLPAGGRPA